MHFLFISLTIFLCALGIHPAIHFLLSQADDSLTKCSEYLLCSISVIQYSHYMVPFDIKKHVAAEYPTKLELFSDIYLMQRNGNNSLTFTLLMS